MTTRYYMDLEQKSPEWYEVRRGIVTASAVGKLLTSTLKVAENDGSRGLINTLAAERITGRVVETRTTDAMWRGILDEPLAREHYADHHADVVTCGFVRQDKGDGHAFTLGYSPDGLVGDEGLIEVKSREPHLHLTMVLDPHVPHAHMAQMQAGLLVTGRKWCDYLSWAGGMPMGIQRIEPDPEWFAAIQQACEAAEDSIGRIVSAYHAAVKDLPPTEYIEHFTDAERFTF